MSRKWVNFKTAAGKTVKFAARQGAKAGRYAIKQGKAYAARQRAKAQYKPYEPPRQRRVAKKKPPARRPAKRPSSKSGRSPGGEYIGATKGRRWYVVSWHSQYKNGSTSTQVYRAVQAYSPQEALAKVKSRLAPSKARRIFRVSISR